MSGSPGLSSRNEGSPNATTFLTLPPLSGGLVVPNDHFFRPKPPSTMPWELSFSERKAASKDPRMAKHSRDEQQWRGTMVEDIWNDIRRFALALNDWFMNPEELLALMRYWGMQSAYLHAKLWELLDTKQTGKINALILCKYMEHMIIAEPYRSVLFRHCYSLFGSRIDVRLLSSVQLQNPYDSESGKKRKRGVALPATMKSGANYMQVKSLLARLPHIPRASPDIVDFDEFVAAISDPAAADFWKTCAAQILEVLCGQCFPPIGTLPLLSLKWLNTAEPVASGDVMYDADIALLRQLELAGGEALERQKKKKTKKPSAK